MSSSLPRYSGKKPTSRPRKSNLNCERFAAPELASTHRKRARRTVKAARGIRRAWGIRPRRRRLRALGPAFGDHQNQKK